jgi:hypothetical protein
MPIRAAINWPAARIALKPCRAASTSSHTGCLASVAAASISTLSAQAFDPPAGGDQLDQVVRVRHRGRIHGLQQPGQFGARRHPLQVTQIRPTRRVITAVRPRTWNLEHAFESRSTH